jgi:hypothetical protein
MLIGFLQQHDPKHKYLAAEMLRLYNVAQLAIQLEKHYGKVRPTTRYCYVDIVTAMLCCLRAAFQ